MISINAKMIVCVQAAALVFFISSVAEANDTAAERTPAGLVFKTIDDVSIDKEVLKISRKKIEVSYVFRNNSDKDVVTDVAFPIPNYEYVEMGVSADPSFDDFTVFVEGVKIKYEIVAKALLKGRDYTELLTKKGIAVYGRGADSDSILKIVGQDKDNFVKLGLIGVDGEPIWTVSKTYVWKQRFPKNSTTRIKHS